MVSSNNYKIIFSLRSPFILLLIVTEFFCFIASASPHDPESLLKAVLNNNLQGVKQALEGRGRVDFRDKEGASVLNIAVKNNRFEIVKVLLQHGGYRLYSEVLEKEKQSLLMIAVQNGFYEIAQFLLKKRRYSDSTTERAWQLADKEGHKAIAQLIDQTQLRSACMRSCTFDARCILSRSTIDFDKRDLAYLSIASDKGNESLVHLLLASGACPDIKDKWGCETALYRAAINGFTNIVRLLLDYKADSSCTNKSKNIPLHVAPNTDIVTLLVNSGCDINVKNQFKRTPLWCACNQKREQVAAALLFYGANPELKDQSNRTPIMVAAQKGSVLTVQQLLCRGALLPKEEALSDISLRAKKRINDHGCLFYDRLKAIHNEFQDYVEDVLEEAQGLPKPLEDIIVFDMLLGVDRSEKARIKEHLKSPYRGEIGQKGEPPLKRQKKC